MKTEALENTPRETILIYECQGQTTEVEFLGMTAGKADVRFPGGLDARVSVTLLSDPLRPELTPTQELLLIESYQCGFVTSLSRQTAQPNTARNLIALGLALPASGREHPGASYEPISVWGGPLTDRGRTVAECLIAEKEEEDWS